MTGQRSSATSSWRNNFHEPAAVLVVEEPQGTDDHTLDLTLYAGFVSLRRVQSHEKSPLVPESPFGLLGVLGT